eukprot:355265-Chlamydomonas_euryale.AAC.23
MHPRPEYWSEGWWCHTTTPSAIPHKPSSCGPNSTRLGSSPTAAAVARLHTRAPCAAAHQYERLAL